MAEVRDCERQGETVYLAYAIVPELMLPAAACQDKSSAPGCGVLRWDAQNVPWKSVDAADILGG